jgi:hypothetical protein
MAHLYEIGTGAWQPDATEGWVKSEVESKVVEGDKVKLVFRLENGEVCLDIHLRTMPWHRKWLTKLLSVDENSQHRSGHHPG